MEVICTYICNIGGFILGELDARPTDVVKAKWELGAALLDKVVMCVVLVGRTLIERCMDNARKGAI